LDSFSIFLRLLKEVNEPSHIVDIYLAATALDNGITTIVSFNDKDFTGIPDISVINPKVLNR
jgi:predicted nucleic acid-binding protein